jgi:hypothetical protein
LSAEQLQCELQKESEVTKGLKRRLDIQTVLLRDYNPGAIAQLAGFSETEFIC